MNGTAGDDRRQEHEKNEFSDGEMIQFDRVAVYAGTRNIYHNMATAAKSLLNHTRVDRVWFLIEDDAFPEEIPEVIRVKNMRGQRWFDPEGPNYQSRWTYMTLTRLALTEILPEEHRAVWLDVDTIVTEDIGELFDMDLQGNLIGAAVEIFRGAKPFTYYNAGVLLMDLDALRKGKAEDLIRTVNRRKLDFPDQDAINLRMQGEILRIPADYNSCDWTGYGTHPKVVHFAADREYATRDLFRKTEQTEWRVKGG